MEGAFYEIAGRSGVQSGGWKEKWEEGGGRRDKNGGDNGGNEKNERRKGSRR